MPKEYGIDAVVITTGPQAFRRADGIGVVPAALLQDGFHVPHMSVHDGRLVTEVDDPRPLSKEPAASCQVVHTLICTSVHIRAAETKGSVGFEWSRSKSDRNREKHGIGFEEVVAVFRGPRIDALSPRSGEMRWVTTGAAAGRCWTVVYTRRSGRLRIISARRARRNEEEAYRRITGQEEAPED